MEGPFSIGSGQVNAAKWHFSPFQDIAFGVSPVSQPDGRCASIQFAVCSLREAIMGTCWHIAFEPWL